MKLFSIPKATGYKGDEATAPESKRCCMEQRMLAEKCKIKNLLNFIRKARESEEKGDEIVCIMNKKEAIKSQVNFDRTSNGDVDVVFTAIFLRLQQCWDILFVRISEKR